MRQARDRQRESIALSGSNPGKSVANIFRHRSSSKRGHELPPLLNDNKVFLTDDTDKAELFSDFFAKHLATESDPVPFVRSLSDRTLSTINVSSDLIKKHIKWFCLVECEDQSRGERHFEQEFTQAQSSVATLRGGLHADFSILHGGFFEISIGQTEIPSPPPPLPPSLPPSPPPPSSPPPPLSPPPPPPRNKTPDRTLHPTNAETPNTIATSFFTMSAKTVSPEPTPPLNPHSPPPPPNNEARY
ncbi:hypothetical protein SprV_0702264600 [Sparganum proliferum]